MNQVYCSERQKTQNKKINSLNELLVFPIPVEVTSEKTSRVKHLPPDVNAALLNRSRLRKKSKHALGDSEHRLTPLLGCVLLVWLRTERSTVPETSQTRQRFVSSLHLLLSPLLKSLNSECNRVIQCNGNL